MLVASFFRGKRIALATLTVAFNFGYTCSYIPVTIARAKSFTKVNSFTNAEYVLDTVKADETKRTNDKSKSSYKLKRNTRNDVEKLYEYQTKAEEIMNGFKPKEFIPAPFSTNPHFQTIAGVYVRKYPYYAYWNTKLWLQSITNSPNNEILEDDTMYWDRRQRINTPDGDFFDVDWKYSSGIIKGKVVIQHGLEANSNSSLCIELAESYVSKGFDVACINFRGCSGEPNLTNGAYHLGFTDDMKYFLSIISLGTNVPIYLVGFSLGANVILKLLGELGTAAKDKFNIKGAAVNSAPFNTEIHYLEMLKPGINRYVYTPNFMKTLKQKAKVQYAPTQVLL